MQMTQKPHTHPQLFAPLRLPPHGSKWHLTNIRYRVRSDYVCSAARHLKLTAHLLQPVRRILASRTDVSWWLTEIKERLLSPRRSTFSPLFSCSVSFCCLQSCGFSFRVLLKMADGDNAAFTKRTGGFFIAGHAAKTRTHTSTLKRGTLMSLNGRELISVYLPL